MTDRCVQARDRYEHFADLSQQALARAASADASDYYDLALGVIARNCECFDSRVYETWCRACTPAAACQ